MTHIIDIKKYENFDKRTGQIRAIDSRSLQWVHDWLDPQHKKKFIPKTYQLGVPILDQSNLLAQGIHTSELVRGVPDASALGSCTANSSVYTTSVIVPADEFKKRSIDISTAVAGEKVAIIWYSDFTFADEFLSQNYGPDDCGSSGLGAGKTLKKYGLIKSYTHAKNAESLCSMLQKGPANIGMPWMNAFFEPGKNAFIDANPNWKSSGVAGGHEICIASLDKVVQGHDGKVDLDKTVIAFPNSWNRSWGDDGWGRMTLRTYQILRSQIDVIQFNR